MGTNVPIVQSNGIYSVVETPDRQTFSVVFDRPSTAGMAKVAVPPGSYWVNMRGQGFDYDQRLDITDGTFKYPGGLDTIDLMLIPPNAVKPVR
jgi:hypothetical protein